MPNAILSNAMKERWFILFRSMVVVGELDEEVALQCSRQLCCKFKMQRMAHFEGRAVPIILT